MRRAHAVLIAALLAGGVVAVGAVQQVDAKPRKAIGKVAPGKKPAKPKPDEAASAEAAPEPPKTEPKKLAGSADAGAANVVGVSEQADSGVKTYKFGGQEIEGRLKSPQIIYFLRRVRAEFASGELGHRSFMRELSDTRRDPAFR